MRNLLLLICLLVFIESQAQNTLSYTDNDVHFRNGIELYEKKVYAAAREELRQYIEINEKSLNPNDFNLTTAEYYSALAGLYSKSPDADIEIERFVIKHSEHPKAKVIYVDLGKYFYEQGDYEKAIVYLEKATQHLGDNSMTEVDFKLGMSYYQTKNYNKALPLLNQAKISDSEFANEASYYAAIINFNNDNLDAALADFKRIDSVNPYRSEVPNWVASILYRQKKYDELLTYTEAIIANPQGRKLDDLALLTAEVHFFKSNYEKAAKYYDMFRNFRKGASVDEQIIFRHGYSLFKIGEFKKAADYLKKVASRNDLMGQQAAYYLGIASLKNVDYQAASAAFGQAKVLDFDKNIKEEALFNYAKTQIDVGNNVQGVTDLQTYLKAYPNGKFEDEANEILSDVLFQSNNYASAINYIESLKRKTTKINEAYQKLCYNQGVLEFNGEHFDKAIINFDKSLSQPISQDIKKNAMFWKAESAYALKHDDAPALYKDVLALNDDVLKQKSRYSLGYLFYNNKEYLQALSYFKDFTAKSKNDVASRQNYDDAILRMADCNLVGKNYVEALKLYDQSINSSRSDKDYAIYQKALTLTFMGKGSDAKVLYEKLSQQYPNSRLLDDAYYQNGVIALENSNYQESINLFSKLLRERPKSSLLPSALLKRALAYSNLKNYEASISDYRVIVTKFCSAPEAQEALTGLQDVLTNVGRPEEFSDALAAYKRGCPESGSVDNLEYENAKNLYLTEKYDKAIQALQRFIANNPNSNNAFEAKYYLADSYYSLNDKSNALKYYNQVVADNRSTFITKAAMRAGAIELGNKSFRNAIADYRAVTTSSSNKRDIVSAWQGLVEAYYNSGNYDSTMAFCREIITNGGNIVIGASNKAQLYLGKSYMQKGDATKAEEEFKKTIVMAKDVNGAEAKYFIGYMQYQGKKYKESIKTLQELAQDFSDFLYWYEKSFLLIADDYIALDDVFMAKATLKSIIENSDTAETKDNAKAKLKSLENK